MFEIIQQFYFTDVAENGVCGIVDLREDIVGEDIVTNYGEERNASWASRLCYHCQHPRLSFNVILSIHLFLLRPFGGKTN